MRDLLITNGQAVSIGRASENDVVLDDPRSQGGTPRAGRSEATDRGSTNGTYLRGRRVYDAEVRAGDPIRFGDAELTLRTEDTKSTVRGRVRCTSTGRLFGVRYCKQGRCWLAEATFPLDEQRARAFGRGSFRMRGHTADYPGCPFCGGKDFVGCGCGELQCAPEADISGSYFTCPWCQNTGKVKYGVVRTGGAEDQG
jgi:hypothetical protein